MSLKNFFEGWNDFFFKPISPLPISVYRILYGSMVLLFGALLAPDLLTWIGDQGSLSRETARQLTSGPRIHLMMLLPRGDIWVEIFFAVFLLCALMLTLGFKTRLSALLVFLGLSSLHHRNILILNSGDTFLRLSAFYLMFSQAGKALSLDRFLRVKKGKEVGPPVPQPPWAQRLLQIQVCFVYFTTFWSKISGDFWVGGTSLYYTSRLEEFWRFHVPYVFEHLWTIKLATWSTLVVEFSMAFLVWFWEIRYFVLAAGVLLHFGIEYSMNIPLFSFVMVAAYVTFIPAEDLQILFSGSAVSPADGDSGE